MSFIGIDLGTSFIKGAVLHTSSRRIDHVRRVPFPQPVSGLDPRYCEYEPAQVVSAVKAMVLELAALASPCTGLVMCTQLGSMVLVNSSGDAVSRCFGWRDQRAVEPHPSGAGSYHAILRERIGARHRSEMGNELPVGSPASFLFWLAEQNLLSPGVTPMSLGDFVVSSLCHPTAPSVDATTAMAFELLDLSSMQWHTRVIEDLNLTRLRFPAVRKQGEIAGWLEEYNIPCFTPVGDYQCALLGALLSEDELSLNISTGSQVSRIVPQLVLDDACQTRPFFDGRFAHTITHLPAGRSLDVLVDLLSEIARNQGTGAVDPWPYILAAAEAIGRTDLDVNLSFFPGPRGDRGSIRNIDEKTLSVGTLFRAAFENMAENYYASAARIWPGQSWRRIAFSGGLSAKLPQLRQIIQDRFQIEARVSPVAEDTLCGLLLLATVFSGESVSVEQATETLRAQGVSA